MDRRKFITNLGSPVIAACAVCLAGCSKSGDSPTGSGTTPTPANFTIDLNGNLTAVGSSLVQSGVIVVRLAAGNTPSSFTAVEVSCPHQGTAINFNAGGNKFICPNHGSTFTTTGAVTQGPANRDLKQYNISITGNIMTVTS